MSDNFEIVFSFDTTGSMYSCLKEVREKLGEIVRELKNKIPGIRIAIFAHGDYCDARSTYVTKNIDFTDDANSLCNFVRNVGATHGGDEPECYELVMREVQEKLSWSSDSQKALVLIGDALPHDKTESQNYRHLDWKEETERLRERDIKIYAVECNGVRHQNFYQHIAAKTFGYFMPLSNFNEVRELMMKICFREAGLESSTSTTSLSFTYSPAQPDVSPPPIPSFGTPIVFDDDNSDYDSEEPKCVVKYVKETRQCPQAGCTEAVDPECDNVKLFQAYLDYMFVDYGKILAETRGGSEDDISVSTMNGDTAWITYNANMSIVELKGEVRKQLGIPENQQKLLFNEQTLKTAGGARLSTYNIQKNSSISVIVPLFCIPENLDHVVFDLSWEFPKVNPDFLDATCFAFSKTEFIQVIDWNHPTNDYYLKGAIKHTAENIKSAGGRIGHQKIEVYIKRLPTDVTHVYFTLSSWRSPNLSAFSHPSLQFYEASEPGVNLCSTTFGHALSSQAVVICYLTRVGKEWQIKECDSNGCVDGNAKRYNPIRKKIVDLIKDDMDS